MMKGLQPGSVADRAVSFLRSLGTGGETTGAVIGDAIDYEPNGLSACLRAQILAGAVVIRKAGRSNIYSLGTGVPLARDEDDDQVQQRRVAARGAEPVGADPSNASIFAKGAAIPHPTSWQQPPPGRRKKAVAPPEARLPKKRKKPGRRPPPATRLIPVAAPPARAPITERPEPELGVAFSNRGELFLEPAGGAAVRLTRGQTQDLLAFLLKLDQLATPIAQRITAP